MNEYHNVNVKLSDFQLGKLKAAAKKCDLHNCKIIAKHDWPVVDAARLTNWVKPGEIWELNIWI